MLPDGLSSDRVVLRCERHVAQASPGSREDGVSDRRRNADDTCLSCTCGGQILAIKQDNIDLRGIAQAWNAVLREARVLDPAVREQDPFEECAAYALNQRALHLVAKTIGIHDRAA